jgi:uncharacterized membrane protein
LENILEYPGQYVCYREKNMKIVSNLKKISRPDRAAYALITLFILVFTLLSFGRHDSLKSYLNDLGVYDQAIWNTLHGNFFQASAIMVAEKNYLAAHFSPILILFAPLYMIWANPKWFLFIQSLAVGLSALPIYWFAKEKSKNFSFALVFLAGYLLCPVLANGILYDFHEVVLATVFASFAFYYLEKNNDRLFILFSSLLVLSQEHLSLLVLMMGLYLVFIKKRKKFGLAVSLISLTYFLLVVGVFMPYFSTTGGQLALLLDDPIYGSRYAWLGKSMPEIAKNIFFHPGAVFKVLASKPRFDYLFRLIVPVFSLGLFSWPILIILPLLAINLLSANAMMFNIFFYHSAVLTPFIFFSGIITMRRWFFADLFLRRVFLVLVAGASAFAAYFWTVTPLSPNYKISDYVPSAREKKIDEVKKFLPADASLSVQHNLGPHFSERKEIYRFPLMMGDAKYILLDETDPFQGNPKQLFGFEYALQMSPLEWRSDIEDLKKSDKYDLIYDKDGYLLFKSKIQISK